MESSRPISGHVYRHEGLRGPLWRAKYRLPDGRQVHRTIGKAWTERGRPPDGFFTKRMRMIERKIATVERAPRTRNKMLTSSPAPGYALCASTTCATPFGTRMIAHADIRRVQEWMGHADIQTTMRYLRYAPRPDDAALVAKAFFIEVEAQLTNVYARAYESSRC